MTVAICINCGAKKVGSLTPCSACGFAPSTCEDQAKSIALSDNCMAAEELHVVGVKIKAGEHLAYDEAFIRKMAQTIQQNPK
ncbi:MAG: hypothetical protein KKE86_13490, partial [Planctomycetes bacterium]|nr:hypothetical protein [Planctomycetota bacterium]